MSKSSIPLNAGCKCINKIVQDKSTFVASVRLTSLVSNHHNQSLLIKLRTFKIITKYSIKNKYTKIQVNFPENW